MRDRHPVETYSSLVPMVVEQSARGERAYDIYPACSRSASSS